MNSREMSDVFPAKDEEHHNNNAANNEKGSSSNPPSSSTLLSSWSRLKDPRIVRVSRAFGGKDRHSKVCTVRGLRDRRVRLSVPTAIQLYDLQDRLGLNQPSKVVDWLLNVAKNEIDELPPLQMPAVGGNLIEENFRSILGSHLGKEVESNVSNPWISDTLLRNNDKEVEGQGLSLVNNSSSSEQQFMTWDSSSSSTLSLAQSRNSAMCSSTHDDDVHHHHHHHQQHDHHHHHQSNFNVLPFMTSATHQVLVYPPHQSYFGSSNINLSATTTTTEEEENEDYVPKQFSFHMLDSSSENVNRFSNPQDLQF